METQSTDSFESLDSTFVCNFQENSQQVSVQSNITVRADYTKLWGQFNRNAEQFTDIFEEKSEQEILKSVFLETNEIARILNIKYEEIPIGIFCSTSEDLKKLELFMTSIKYNLKKDVNHSERKRKVCKCFKWWNKIDDE